MFFSQRLKSASECDVTGDKWDGYQAERDRVVTAWRDAAVRNMVVLTGDIHQHFAAAVSSGFGVDNALAAELVCSSITSRGANSTKPPPTLPFNPNLKYSADKRGYVRCRLTPNDLTAEFVVVSDVREPSFDLVDVGVDRTFVVEDRRPGVQPA